MWTNNSNQRRCRNLPRKTPNNVERDSIDYCKRGVKISIDGRGIMNLEIADILFLSYRGAVANSS